NQIEDAWKIVREFLPKGNDPPEPVKQILLDLGCLDKKEEVRQKCQGRDNPFHKWFAGLDRALDELRDAIEHAEGER
ncbi:MAG: hypothetical protein ACK40X_14970, partial [Armatimonadota bacterium]